MDTLTVTLTVLPSLLEYDCIGTRVSVLPQEVIQLSSEVIYVTSWPLDAGDRGRPDDALVPQGSLYSP